MSKRTEKDSIGNIEVDSSKYWGAQTQRSLQNFDIGYEKMPWEIIESFAVLKMAAAETNYELGVLDKKKMEVIVGVCGEIIDGKLMDHFPLSVWQTGSGTQSNMNVNEVIANRAHVVMGGKLTDKEKKYTQMMMWTNHNHLTILFLQLWICLHSTLIKSYTIPCMENLAKEINNKSKEFKNIVKIGTNTFYGTQHHLLLEWNSADTIPNLKIQLKQWKSL